MKHTLLQRGSIVAAFLALAASAWSQIAVDSFDSPFTPDEISTFKTYIHTLQPVVWSNMGLMQSEYAQGHSGESINAMGLPHAGPPLRGSH